MEIKTHNNNTCSGGGVHHICCYLRLYAVRSPPPPAHNTPSRRRSTPCPSRPRAFAHSHSLPRLCLSLYTSPAPVYATAGAWKYVFLSLSRLSNAHRKRSPGRTLSLLLLLSVFYCVSAGARHPLSGSVIVPEHNTITYRRNVVNTV